MIKFILFVILSVVFFFRNNWDVEKGICANLGAGYLVFWALQALEPRALWAEFNFRHPIIIVLGIFFSCFTITRLYKWVIWIKSEKGEFKF
jgi:hypothetical protein